MNYEIILIVIAGCLACVYFGHWMTLKSIGYVQPAYHKMLWIPLKYQGLTRIIL
jgi:hypothetical protein